MIFINPKTEFAFKKIFGSEEQEILISFLNALLYEGQAVIEELEILHPYHLAPKIRGFKDNYLNVKVRNKFGKTVIIEMQVLNLESFEKRILYKAAKNHSFPLRTGLDYTLDHPVIALTITNFELFPNQENGISHFLLTDLDYLSDYHIFNIELVFVELTKFTKHLDELETITDKWIYFFKNARELHAVPEVLGSIPEIQQAFEIANQANLTPEELEDLEIQEMFIQDMRGELSKAARLGIEQGRREAKFEIAKRLLNILDEETISQTTGLSLEEVQSLGRGEGE